jgi:hypothetical protein
MNMTPKYYKTEDEAYRHLHTPKGLRDVYYDAKGKDGMHWYVGVELEPRRESYGGSGPYSEDAADDVVGI